MGKLLLVYVENINRNIPTTWRWARGDTHDEGVFCSARTVAQGQSHSLGCRSLIPQTQHHHHHHQSLNREGRWGTTDAFTTSLLHFSLFSTALWDLADSRLFIPWCWKAVILHFGKELGKRTHRQTTRQATRCTDVVDSKCLLRVQSTYWNYTLKNKCLLLVQITYLNYTLQGKPIDKEEKKIVKKIMTRRGR